MHLSPFTWQHPSVTLNASWQCWLLQVEVLYGVGVGRVADLITFTHIRQLLVWQRQLFFAKCAAKFSCQHLQWARALLSGWKRKGEWEREWKWEWEWKQTRNKSDPKLQLGKCVNMFVVAIKKRGYSRLDRVRTMIPIPVSCPSSCPPSSSFLPHITMRQVSASVR